MGDCIRVSIAKCKETHDVQGSHVRRNRARPCDMIRVGDEVHFRRAEVAVGVPLFPR